MKIRHGFVSNSSSQSFCIYGVCIGAKEVGIEDDDKLMDKADEAGLFTSYGPEYSDGIYIGREFSTIGDDETGKEFKEGVEKKMEELFGKKIDCGVCECGWYNG